MQARPAGLWMSSSRRPCDPGDSAGMTSDAPTGCPSDLLLLDERCPLPLTEPVHACPGTRTGGVARPPRDLIARGTGPAGRARRVRRGRRSSTRSSSGPRRSRSSSRPARSSPTARPPGCTASTSCRARAVHQMPPDRGVSPGGLPAAAAGRREWRAAHARRDVTVVDGILVTTKLRTALDLGRRLNRFDALGGARRVAPCRCVSTRSCWPRSSGSGASAGVVQLALAGAAGGPTGRVAARVACCGSTGSTRRHACPGATAVGARRGVPALPDRPGDPGAPVRGGVQRRRVPRGRGASTTSERLGWLDEAGAGSSMSSKDEDLYPRCGRPDRAAAGRLDTARRRSGLWVPQWLPAT